jgi:hypothetical protein
MTKKSTAVLLALTASIAGSGAFCQDPGTPAAPPVDVLAPPPEKPALRGYVSDKEISGEAVVEKDNDQRVDITITNSGKRSLVVDAMNGKVIGGVKKEILDRDDVLHPPSSKHTLTDISYVTVSIASFGYFPMAEDEIEKNFLRKDKQPAFYGLDQRRRELGEKQFSKRTLLPGETGRGTLILSGSCPADASFSFPVTEYPSGESVGNLVVNVRPSGTGASGSASAASGTPKSVETVVPVRQ